jgi:hypothetical protein
MNRAISKIEASNSLADLAGRIAALKDEITQKNRRIEELRREIDEYRDLIERLREHTEDHVNCLERWKEAFGMTQGEDGKWGMVSWWETHHALHVENAKLVREFNHLVDDYVPVINGRHRPVGRPIAASDKQQATVLKLHKAGKSLRGIVEETSLGLATVRTIVDKRAGTDRTSMKHRARVERIDPDRQRQITWKRQKRTGDALPQRAQCVIDDGRDLIKEAKGLGHA